MYGDYPILLEGESRGSLHVYADGLMTVFEATADDTGALLRLSVYGGGAEGYLGVMAPAGSGRVALKRRLSRASLAGFPDPIEFAAPAGGLPAPRPLEESASPAESTGGAAGGELSEAGGAASAPVLEPQPPPAEEAPEAPEYGGGDTLWFTTPDGALTTFDGRRSLVALPAGDLRLPPWANGVERIINGRKYVVFPR